MTSSNPERIAVLLLLMLPLTMSLGRRVRGSTRAARYGAAPVVAAGTGADVQARFGPSGWVPALVVAALGGDRRRPGCAPEPPRHRPGGMAGGPARRGRFLSFPIGADRRRSADGSQRPSASSIHWVDIADLAVDAGSWRMAGRQGVVGFSRQRVADVQLVVHRRSGRPVKVAAIRTKTRNVPASVKQQMSAVVADERARELQRSGTGRPGRFPR